MENTTDTQVNITEEEAIKEQEELDQMAELFFHSNPALAINIDMEEAEEEEDEEEITVSLSEDGDVLKEEVVRTDTQIQEVMVPQPAPKQSEMDKQLIKQVILNRIKRMSQAQASVHGELEDAFYEIPGGGMILDNFTDLVRKHRNALSSLALLDEIDIELLEDEGLKRIIKQDIKDFSRKLFNLVDVLSD